MKQDVSQHANLVEQSYSAAASQWTDQVSVPVSDMADVRPNSQPQISVSDVVSEPQNRTQNSQAINEQVQQSIEVAADAQASQAPVEDIKVEDVKEPVVQPVPVPADTRFSFDWFEVFERLECEGLLRSVASHCEFRNEEADKVFFVLNQQQSALYDSKMCVQLEKLISSAINTNIHLEITKGDVQTETPYMRKIRLKKEAHDARVQSFEQDPHVQKMVKHFGAVIDEASVVVISETEH